MKKLALLLAIVLPLTITACAKKEDSQTKAGEGEKAPSTSLNNGPTTPEQQAAIDALDKPDPELIKASEQPAK